MEAGDGHDLVVRHAHAAGGLELAQGTLVVLEPELAEALERDHRAVLGVGLGEGAKLDPRLVVAVVVVEHGPEDEASLGPCGLQLQGLPIELDRLVVATGLLGVFGLLGGRVERRRRGRRRGGLGSGRSRGLALGSDRERARRSHHGREHERREDPVRHQGCSFFFAFFVVARGGRPGLGGQLLALVGRPQRVAGSGLAGLPLDADAVGDGLLLVAQVLLLLPIVDGGQEHVGLHVLGHGGRDGLERHLGLVHASRGEMEAAQAVEHPGILGPQAAGALQVVVGFVELGLVLQQQAQVEVRFEVVGVGGDLRAKRVGGLGAAARVHEGAAEEAVDGGQLGIELGGAPQLGKRARRVLATQVGHRDQEASGGGVAVAQQPVDEGLAAQELSLSDEGVAHQVAIEPILLELALVRRQKLDDTRVVPRLELTVGQKEEGGRVRGVEGDHPLELGEGLRDLGRLVEGQGQVEAHRSQRGIELERLSILLGRILVAAQAREGRPEVGASVDPVGLLGQDALIRLDRAQDVARLMQGHPPGEDLIDAGGPGGLGEGNSRDGQDQSHPQGSRAEPAHSARVNEV